MNGKQMLCASVAVCSALTPVQGATQNTADNSPRYALYRLGAFGGTVAGANGINNIGWVTGYAALKGNATVRAALWLQNSRFDLGTLGGPNSAVDWPVKNDRGEIAGIAETAKIDPLGETWSCNFKTGHTCEGFIWRNGLMHELPTLGGNNGYASGVNNRGQVIGWAENATHDPTCVSPQVLQFEAVIWDTRHHTKHQLPPWHNDVDTAATAINDSGQAVGISGVCDIALGGYSAKRPVLWERDGTVRNLGTFGGAMFNTAAAINNRGQVVGWSDKPGDTITHAFFWTREHGLQDIGTLPGDSISLAYGINDRADVVGQSCDASGNCRAFIWSRGIMRDLNELVRDGSPALLYGNDIDDSGLIAGGSYDPSSGYAPAFVAVPRFAGSARTALPTRRARRVTLPAWLRRQLLQRRNFGRA